MIHEKAICVYASATFLRAFFVAPMYPGQVLLAYYFTLLHEEREEEKLWQ